MAEDILHNEDSEEQDASISQFNGSEPEFDKDEDKGLKEEFTDIDDPFRPSEIDIQPVQTTLDTLIKRLKHNEIDLQPDFQRNSGLWITQYKSRLIESLLIRFPLPAF